MTLLAVYIDKRPQGLPAVGRIIGGSQLAGVDIYSRASAPPAFTIRDGLASQTSRSHTFIT